MQIIENQQTASDADFDQRISNAAQTVRIDSIEYFQNAELFRAGYISAGALQASELKLRKSKRINSQLVSLRSAAFEKNLFELLKLRQVNAQLKEKRELAELRSEIRSASAGILIETRQAQHDSKTQVTFIIGRLP